MARLINTACNTPVRLPTCAMPAFRHPCWVQLPTLHAQQLKWMLLHLAG